jgi:SAM-dependent methyltransferase
MTAVRTVSPGRAMECDGSAGTQPLMQPDVAIRHRIAALDADMRHHDWVVAKMSLATMTWIPAERARLLQSLGVEPGQTVLDHCTGPGSNLPTLAAALGRTGTLVAMDLSGLVVRQARALAERLAIDAHVQQADASALPYSDETFDVVVHYGALNQLGDDQRAAVDEIVRVTRPGGLVVLLDEGLEEHRRDSWWGRLLIWGNPLFAARPPLHLLPAGAEPVVRWVIRGMFYEIRFRKPRA